MDTETKQLLRDLRVSLDQFTRSSGSISKLASKAAAGNGGGGGGSGGGRPGSAGDEFEDWWDKRKREWNESADAVGKFGGTMDRGGDAIGRSFKLLQKNSNDAAQSFLSLTKNLVIGGGMLAGIGAYTMGLGKTYQEMSEAGTRFSNSIFSMADAALSTGTSLEEAARINKKNSVVAAAMNGNGKSGLVGLAANVRRNAEAFGSFGYTVEQLDDLVGDYAETLRQSGHAENLSRGDATDSFMKVAATADTLSNQFGKSRKELMETANAAMRDEVYRSKLAGMSASDAKSYGDAFGAAIMGMSAQAGESGKILSKMLSQAASFDGRAYNTQAARELFNKVLPQGTTMMSKLVTQIEGDKDNALKYQNDYVRQLKQEIKLNRTNLQYLAEGTGAEAAHARQLLQMDADLKESSDDQVKHQIEMNRLAKQNQDALTKITMNFETVWMRFSSNIMSKFLPMLQKPMEAIAKGLDRFSNSPAWTNITKVFTTVGEQMSAWIDGFLSESRMNDLAAWVSDTAKGFGDWLGTIKASDVDGVMSGVKAGAAGILAVISTIWNVAKGFGSLVLMVKDHIAEIAIGLAALYIGLKGFAAVSAISKLLGNNDMNVKAKVVNVNGPMGGGGPWGNQGGNEPGNRRGGTGRGARIGRAVGIAAGIAVVGGGLYALGKNLGVFGGLFEKDQKLRENEIKARTNSTEGLPDVLDDFNRQLLENKRDEGRATQAELDALKKDDDAHAARTARALNLDDTSDDPTSTAEASRSTLANVAAAVAPAISENVMSAFGIAGAAASGVGAMLRRGGTAAAAGAGAAAGAAGDAVSAATSGGRLSRFMGVLGRGVGVVAKATPLLGAVVSGGSAMMEAWNLKKRRDAGEITEAEYQEGLTKAVTAGIVGAIPGVGLADALSGGIASDALGGAIYRNGVAPLTANSTTVPGQVSQPRSPEVTNLEERINTMQAGDQIARTAENVDQAMLKQFEEMNNRLAALIMLYREGTERIVRAADRTSANVGNLAS